ncbi:hypothetical protein ACIO6T_34380 [Streptomyces sp. NPDC087532]|uniref:hypothetical protein n=1 Tax=Streptomyces sp. NPDC087532 TaxID=3365795 RepID=UPI00381662BF
MRQLRLSSVIERRLLVNYRVDPDPAARLLPEPLRPHVVHGYAVVAGRADPATRPASRPDRSEPT